MINMNTVTIESAEQKDYASWLPLWINYQTFYRTKISDEVTKLTWERFLTPSEPVYCAVAKYDGKLSLSPFNMGRIQLLLSRRFIC